MISSSFYPTIAGLIPLEKLPDGIQSLISNAFDDIFYKNYVNQKSVAGDGGFYSMTIVLHKPLGIDFLGDEGFNLILNPDQVGLTTEIPITVSYKLDALKYIRGFDPLAIASDPQYTFELIFELLGLDEVELLEEVIELFYIVSATPLSDFVTDYNSNIDFSGSLTVPGTTGIEAIEDLVVQFNSDPAKNLFEYVFSVLTVDFDGLKRLFARWIGNFSLNDILKLFIPEIYVFLDVLEVALMFPREVLTPIDDFGNKIENEGIRSRLSFNVGAFSYDTRTGFDFQNESSLVLTPSFIGNTNLTINVSNLKIDIRDDKNIPEAAQDGRPNTFKGVYIEAATIGFPNFFTPDAGNTANIIARNLLIGSEGGVSGTVGVETTGDDVLYILFVPTVERDESNILIGYSGFSFNEITQEMSISGVKKTFNELNEETALTIENYIIYIPTDGLTIVDSENQHFEISVDGTVTAIDPPAIGLLQFNLFENIITIDDFYITFSKNKVVSSKVTGSIYMPGPNITLLMEIEFTNGFRIHFSSAIIEGVDVITNSIFTLTLKDLELGRLDEKFFLGVKGLVENNVEIPFVEKFVPNKISFNPVKWTEGDGFSYDLTLEWLNKLKLGLSNDGPPEFLNSKVRIPFNEQKENGLFKIDAIDLTLKPIESGISAKALLRGATINFKDVFILTIDGLGAEVSITEDAEGNISPFNVDFGMVPPTGLGLSVNISNKVNGGGYLYLDFEAGRYIGVGQLDVLGKVDVKIIAIITTKDLAGEKQKSVLLMISAEFSPIEIGFGFTLNGVGGLVAINRTMDLQALRDGVKTNALDNILFPENPIDDVLEIVSDLETVFPIEDGRFVFGLMALIGWGKKPNEGGTPKSLIEIELGLMIEVPNPLRLAILGVVKSKLPTDDNDLLKLQVNFVGTVDFGKKLITFDASIYESNFAKFSIAGDMAFRMKWGDDANFLLSVGGFHPDYTPPPLNLPTMNRLTINLLGKDNPRLTLSTYFAVTSNTVQVGAAVDFYYSVTKNIEVIGGLGFDVLIQFSPFYMKAELYAMLSVVRKGTAILSVSLYGMLEGPAPWHAVGKAEFVVAKVNLSVSFDEVFGEEQHTALPDVALRSLIEDECDKNSNWEGVFPKKSSLMVSLVENQEDTSFIILNHPCSTPRFNQKLVPLNTRINKFGKKVPIDFNEFSVDLVGFESVSIQEQFAPAEFIALSDKEKLARPSFEKLKSGIQVINLDRYESADALSFSVNYEHVVIDSVGPKLLELVPVNAVGFSSWVNNGASSKSKLGLRNRINSNFAPVKTKVNSESFAIANLEDLTLAGGLEVPNVYGSEAEAKFALENIIINNPSLEDQLDVVLEHELV